jgi:hypothetical protein
MHSMLHESYAPLLTCSIVLGAVLHDGMYVEFKAAVRQQQRYTFKPDVWPGSAVTLWQASNGRYSKCWLQEPANAVGPRKLAMIFGFSHGRGVLHVDTFTAEWYPPSQLGIDGCIHSSCTLVSRWPTAQLAVLFCAPKQKVSASKHHTSFSCLKSCSQAPKSSIIQHSAQSYEYLKQLRGWSHAGRCSRWPPSTHGSIQGSSQLCQSQ